MSGSNTETCASKSMRIIRTAVEMRDAVEPARNDGAVVGLVLLLLLHVVEDDVDLIPVQGQDISRF